MLTPGAVRQRRSRLHRKGDHSECLPERCDGAVTGVTSRVTRHEALGVTGTALWKQMTAGGELGPMQQALLVEACRIADRLDRLEAQLSGDDAEWLRVEPDYEDPTAPVVVVVDRALAEARQQATAMKGLLAEIRQAMKPAAAGKSAPAADGSPAPAGSTVEGGNVFSLAAGIAARRPQTAG